MSQVFGDPKRLVNDYMAASHAIGITGVCIRTFHPHPNPLPEGADRGRHFANRHSGVGRNPGAGASFDKLRTNDLLVCLPLSALRERGSVGWRSCLALHFCLPLSALDEIGNSYHHKVDAVSCSLASMVPTIRKSSFPSRESASICWSHFLPVHLTNPLPQLHVLGFRKG